MNAEDLSSQGDPAYWPRLTTYDARVIEQTLAPPTLFSPGLHLQGGVADPAFAATDPPLLHRLPELGSPYLVDSGSLRFIGPNFLEIGGLRELPHAPASPLNPGMDMREFVNASLRFQAGHGAAAFLTPGVPLHARSPEWAGMNRAIIAESARQKGVDVERLPLVVLLAPDSMTTREGRSVIEPLGDVPLDALYVQPLRLKPLYDSVEKLVRYVEFLLEACSLGVPVIAGRVGAFGLVMQALGVPIFDSGLGDAESFDLAALNRRRKPREQRTGGGGGRRKRAYVERLKASVRPDSLDAILRERELRSRFGCQLECCRWAGWNGFLDRRRSHYLHVRLREVSDIAELPSGEMRLHRVHEDLIRARDDAQVVRRMLGARGLAAPRLDHVDRWLAVLARIAGIPVAA